MSKTKLNTKEKILDKALEMFNERGIEYVSLRELAAILGIRVGNITYYFPTKDDLVFALSLELNKRNSAALAAHQNLDMHTFFEMLYQAFQNQVRYRCLLLSVVHLMSQNKHLAENYKKAQVERVATIKTNLKVLIAGGFLHKQAEKELHMLVSGISLIGRFWISEAAISFRDWQPAQQIQHYLKMIGLLLSPYATAKAKEQAADFM